MILARNPLRPGGLLTALVCLSAAAPSTGIVVYLDTEVQYSTSGRNVLSGEQAHQALLDTGCLLPTGETNEWAETTEVVVGRRSARIRDRQPRPGV